MRRSRAIVAACAATAAAGGLAASSIAAPSGLITTVAGTGIAGPGSDTPRTATQATLDTPSDLALLPGGGVLVTDTANMKIRSFTVGGAMSTVAGDGVTPARRDGDVLATAAGFDSPVGVAVTPDKGYVISDAVDDRIRKVTSAGIAGVFAGDRKDGFADGAVATARFDGPAGMAVDTRVNPAGDVYVADMYNHAVRKISGGAVTTVVNAARANEPSPDGASAASTTLTLPTDVAVLSDGDLVVADAGNRRIVRVDRTTDTSRTVVSGTTALSLEATPDGGFVFASSFDARIRHMRRDGSVVVVAGDGTGGDNAPAISAKLSGPAGMAVTATGQLLVAERGGHRVRAIDIDLRPAPVVSPTTPTDPPVPTAPADPPPPGTPAATTPGATTDPAPGPGPGPGRVADGPSPKVADPVAPELGRLVVVAPASGTVRVRRPGGRGFTTLSGGAEIPVGSIVDTRRGTVRLTSSLTRGKVQTARFWGAQFAVRQSRGGDGTTELALAGGSFAACPKAGAATAAARRKPARSLWGDDKGGKYRTRGRNSVATVRGTRWLTQDTCAGTLTRVVEGAVDVRDLRSGTVRRVSAGGSLLVRPGKR